MQNTTTVKQPALPLSLPQRDVKKTRESNINQRKEEYDRRIYFMINLHESKGPAKGHAYQSI